MSRMRHGGLVFVVDKTYESEDGKLLHAKLESVVVGVDDRL